MPAGLIIHDWPQMVRDLRASGMSDWKIANAIGYESPRAELIEAIENGTVPRHDIGEALISLHNLCLKGTSAPHLGLREA